MDEGRAGRVDEPKGHLCPECGAPRGADNTPSCGCGRRASDALLHARTAEAAAAEDFDPLRIRPYVELEHLEHTEGTPGTDGTADAVPRAGSEPGPGQGPDQGARSGPRSGSARGDDGGRPPAGPTGTGAGRGAARAVPGGASATGAGGGPGAAPGTVSGGAPGGAPGGVAENGGSVAEETMALRAVTPGAAGTPVPPSPPHGAGGEGDAVTMPIPAVGAPGGGRGNGDASGNGGRTGREGHGGRGGGDADATTALPNPLAPPATAPSATDLSLFEADGGHGAPGPFDDRERPRRRNRTVLLGAGGAVVAIVAAAGFASGLFSYETPSRDGAPSREVRAGVPDPSRSSVSASPSASASAAAPTSASASPSAAVSASPSSASPSPSSASPSPSASASPSLSTPAAAPTASAAPSGDDRSGATVLRRGDKGPEVVELELRLRQLFLYDRDASGSYNEHVEDAVRNYQWSRGIQAPELGVYDRTTRARLESETTEP